MTHATTPHNPLPYGSGAFFPARAFAATGWWRRTHLVLERAWAGPRLRWRARQQFAALDALDDRTLHDIGLDRADLRDTARRLVQEARAARR